MDSARVLREARRRAGLTQRRLAELVDTPQPAIARIESGKVSPLVDTLDRMLRACGQQLQVAPIADDGVDRELIRRLLTLTHEERLDRLVGEVHYIYEMMRKERRRKRARPKSKQRRDT